MVEVLTQKDADRHLLEQTERLAVTLDALDDLAVPSLCAGWSRAHVVAPLARNADGMSTMARSAHGEPLTMHASAAAREADIEAGARRPDRANIKDAITSGRRVRADLAGITPDVAGSTVHRLPGVPFGTAAEMSHRRLREVAYHHVDWTRGSVSPTSHPTFNRPSSRTRSSACDSRRTHPVWRSGRARASVGPSATGLTW